MKRFISTLFVLMVVFSLAHAQNTAPSYAVLSLIGDQLSTVIYTGQTGTQMPPTKKLVEPINSTAFDDIAVVAAGDAITATQPVAVKNLLSTKNPNLYKLQDKLVDSGNEAARESIRAMLKETPADYLIVLTKYRGDAKIDLPLQNKTTGSGKLEGIGFYLDPLKKARALQDGRGKGLVASYAYVKALLIDAKTLQVVRDQVSTSNDVTINLTTSFDTWDVATPEQKNEALQKVVRAAADDSVRKLLQPG